MDHVNPENAVPLHIGILAGCDLIRGSAPSAQWAWALCPREQEGPVWDAEWPGTQAPFSARAQGCHTHLFALSCPAPAGLGLVWDQHPSARARACARPFPRECAHKRQGEMLQGGQEEPVPHAIAASCPFPVSPVVGSQASRGRSPQGAHGWTWLPQPAPASRATGPGRSWSC